MTARVAVLASGGGSNLQALIDHFHAAQDLARVSLVLADRADRGALARAARARIPHAVISFDATGERVAGDMLRALGEADIEWVALAGFIRLVPPDVVARYRDHILNIHPALLPAFGGRGMYGLRVHQAVLAAGARVSGATVHIVDEQYDRGRIIAQWPVPVLSDDDAESLAARVLRVEHLLYPAALEACVCGVERPAPGHAAFVWSQDDAPAARQIRRALGLSDTHHH